VPASIGDDHTGPDEKRVTWERERVTWSVLAEVEYHLDAAGVHGDRQEVVVGRGGGVLQQQQPRIGVASHAQLDPVGPLTFLSASRHLTANGLNCRLVGLFNPL